VKRTRRCEEDNATHILQKFSYVVSASALFIGFVQHLFDEQSTQTVTHEYHWSAEKLRFR
jgi:hypothetical protein